MRKKMLRALACGMLLACAGIAGAAETAAKNPVVLMQTGLGKIKIELFTAEAPISVKNFLGYAAADIVGLLTDEKAASMEEPLADRIVAWLGRAASPHFSRLLPRSGSRGCSGTTAPRRTCRAARGSTPP